MLKEQLYFIALIPKRELREKIYFFQNQFKERFNSCKALNVYPHITLKAPFKCSEAGRRVLLNWFNDVVLKQLSFSIKLSGFGAFPNKKSPVIFINPVSAEMVKMQQEMIMSFSSFFPGDVSNLDRKFKPHITVAYRDLSPEMFAKAWPEFKDKSFNEVFEIDAIHLLQHDRKKWNIIATHDLASA